ncbi:MAG: hypothetical protein HN348_28870 [Proteobacteria bacterium]|nr:hypothetical protein [Pseudomonadota bacterium]
MAKHLDEDARRAVVAREHVEQLAGEDVGMTWAWVVDGELWDTGDSPAEAREATRRHIEAIGAPELGGDGYAVCLLWWAPGRLKTEIRTVLADHGIGHE